MADLYADVDTALSEVPINLMPIVVAAGATIDEGLTYNEAGLDLNWNFFTTAGAFSQTNLTPTDTGGAHDFVNQGNGMYTVEIPASGGTINNDTEGFGWFSGFCTACLPWRGPVIGFRAAALNNSLIDGATVDVNTTHVSGTAQTANDNGLDVNAILALLDDARTEPGQGAPPVNPDLATKIDYLYKTWRNKKDNDGSVRNIYNDAGAVVDQKSSVAEAAGTTTLGEMASGP